MVRPATFAALLLSAGLTAPAIAEPDVQEVCYPYGDDSEICLPATAANERIVEWELPEDWQHPSDAVSRKSDGRLSRFLKGLSDFQFNSFASPAFTYEY